MRGLLSGKAIFPFTKSQAPSGCLLFKAETVATKVVTLVPPLGRRGPYETPHGLPLTTANPKDCRFIVDVTSFCMPSS